MYSYEPPHMAKQKQDDQLEHTYSSYVRIRDVALKTCQKRWMIGRSGERGSGISVLAARHDDDDDGLELVKLLGYGSMLFYLKHSSISNDKIFLKHYIYMYIYSQPFRTNTTQHKVNFKHNLKGLKSDIFFSYINCHNKFRDSRGIFYQIIPGGSLVRFIPFPLVLTLCILPHPQFELGSLCRFPTKITIILRTYIYMCLLSIMSLITHI